jgi:acylphosphatase
MDIVAAMDVKNGGAGVEVVVDGEDEACAKMSFYLGQGARSLSGMI